MVESKIKSQGHAGKTILYPVQASNFCQDC